MKRVVLTIPTLAVLALVGNMTLAATGHPGGGVSARYSSVSYGRSSPYADAARRVMERHSRDRYQTHPRSYYNAPSRGVKYYPGGYGYYGGGSRGRSYGYYGGGSRGRSYGYYGGRSRGRSYGYYYYERGHGYYGR